MQDPVRIKLPDGAEVTHERAFAESLGLKVLDDKPGLGLDGRALHAKPPVDLRGKQLDEALKAAGLPTSGTAEEKRDRLADHESGGQAVGATPEESS